MNIPVEKNKQYIVEIIDNGFQGEGIAKIDNFTIFIPNAIKGEKVKALIVKVLSSHAFGKIIEIIEPSKERVEPDCATYKRCGGCSLRHVKYKETLKMKQNAVKSLVDKTLKNPVNVLEPIGMEKPFYYRNKAQFPLGLDKENMPQLGVYANRTHEIVPIEKCLIQNEEAQKVAKTVLNFIKKNNLTIYNEKTGKGLFRHIVIKVGLKTKEIMCILVLNGKGFNQEQELVEELTNKYPNIKTIVKNINMKNTNVILGLENVNIYGDGYIKDILGDYTFKISPLSFYQVNPVQAEKLYNIGVEKAEISKEDVVFDLYCGIGTISLFMSKYAKKVYGVEIVEQAIEDAKENAKLNNIENVEFIAGDAEIVLDDLINKKKIIPDVVMVDPPRKGLDNTSIENILKIKPKRVVYISCNPATLVRDLAKFEETYSISDIQPVDMFPYTSHVECVCVMKKKEYIDEIKKMKKIMLHLHLDGSLRPETVLQWLIDEEDYKALGFENKEKFLETNKEELLEKVKRALMVNKDCRDLNEYLEKFDLPCKQLQTEKHITQATFELFEDLVKQNVIYAEVRFAPNKHREKGLDYNQIVEAAIKGMNKAKEKYHIGGSLILCAMRGDNETDNLETIRVAKKYLEKGVSAVDLAGAEVLFPTSDYENIFKEASNLNIPFTIHAGEAAGAESIKKALDFGAKRIGHGVRCLEDSDLVYYLVKNNVVLEVCPISNLQTKATGENHPIEELYRKQLKVTVNTDNNTVSNTDIINEYKWILEHTALDLNDLQQMNINAVRGVFNVSEDEKEQLIKEIEKIC